MHCEAPPTPKPPPAARAQSTPGQPRAKRLVDDPVANRPLVNTHADYTGNDAVRRTQLGGATLAELTRLAHAHSSLLDGLGLRELG